MSEDPNKPETPAEATGTAPAAETPAQQERVFTGKEVEAIVRDRLARAKKEPKPEPTAQPKEEPKPSDPVVADLKAKYEFAEALNDLEWKPSKDDRETLRDMFLAKGLEAMTKLAVRLKPPDQPSAPAAPTQTAVPPNGNGTPYKSPGAPAGAPPEVLERNATKWSADYIRQLQEQGTFLQELEKYRGSLPGGGNGIFRKRIPGK